MPLLRARGGHRERPPLVRELTAAGSEVGQGETCAPGGPHRIGQGVRGRADHDSTRGDASTLDAPVWRGGEISGLYPQGPGVSIRVSRRDRHGDRTSGAAHVPDRSLTAPRTWSSSASTTSWPWRPATTPRRRGSPPRLNSSRGCCRPSQPVQDVVGSATWLASGRSDEQTGRRWWLCGPHALTLECRLLSVDNKRHRRLVLSNSDRQ